MVKIAYKAKNTPTAKVIASSIIIIDFVLAWIFFTVFGKYIQNVLQLKLDLLSSLIVGGFSFIIILIFLASTSLLTAAEYVLTENELIIRTWWLIKYAEQKIPYHDIERVFLYISWDFRGNEQRLVLIKRYGKLDVNIMYPTRATLIFLNLEDPGGFIQSLASLVNIRITYEETKAIKTDKVIVAEGKQFAHPSLIVLGVLCVISLLVVSPLLLLIAHLLVEPTLLSMNFTDLFMISFFVSLFVIVFIPSALNTIQSYLVTREGLYIKKMLATIFIPRDVIKGFVYMDVNEKSGRGGGLLKIGDAVTLIAAKNFNDFLETMKQYGYRISERSNGKTITIDVNANSDQL